VASSVRILRGSLPARNRGTPERRHTFKKERLGNS
jgi:hypothetical protein